MYLETIYYITNKIIRHYRTFHQKKIKIEIMKKIGKKWKKMGKNKKN